jgi:serine O-acetyltransferase
MIQSKKDYLFYLEADRLSLGVKRKRPLPFIGSEIWKFQRLLRQREYWNNCLKNKSILHKLYYYFIVIRFHRRSLKLGVSIPINVFGPGLAIIHHNATIVSSSAKIGENCRIHACVNIGHQDGNAPKIGDNVYIGPGAKIFGGVKIADGIAIGANSVVNKSFLQQNISIAGIPAKKISDKGSFRFITRGTEILRLQAGSGER